MRFFEFGGVDANIDKLIMAFRNHIGRAASQKSPSVLNWNAISQISRANGFEFAADYETFKSMYDSTPALQKLVKNFNSSGVALNVPGAPDSEQPEQDGEDAQDKVNQTAASAAEKNLSK
jgi:hypothetical protein